MAEGIAAKVSKSVTVYNEVYDTETEVNADVAPKFKKSVPAAKAGTLTTRTDNDTGTLTMNTGHGITTGVRLDVYWTDANGVEQVRYGMTVGTVSGDSVPIDGGGGENLPAQGFAIRAMVPLEEVVTVVGANVVYLTVYSKQGGTFVYAQSGNTYIYHFQTRSDSESRAKSWSTADGSTNPVTGQTIGKVFLSHGNVSQAVSMYGVIGYN